jgi:hypothetical protein
MRGGSLTNARCSERAEDAGHWMQAAPGRRGDHCAADELGGDRDGIELERDLRWVAARREFAGLDRGARLAGERFNQVAAASKITSRTRPARPSNSNEAAAMKEPTKKRSM